MKSSENQNTKQESMPQEKKGMLSQSPPVNYYSNQKNPQATVQVSPDLNSKNFRTRMLSPQTQKQSVEAMLDKMELNNKNFPSKANVCKGESSERLRFSPQHSNSPIVNYYAGMSPNSNHLYSPDVDYHNFNKNEVPFYQCQGFGMNNSSNQYHNFNFSPSAIFNVSGRRLSNTSVNKNETKTLQEKIEGNFNDGLQKNQNNKPYIPSSVESNKSDLKKGNDDSDENQELYMLSFNGEEEELNDIEEIEGSDNSDKDDGDTNGFQLNISDGVETHLLGANPTPKPKSKEDIPPTNLSDTPTNNTFNNSNNNIQNANTNASTTQNANANANASSSTAQSTTINTTTPITKPPAGKELKLNQNYPFKPSFSSVTNPKPSENLKMPQDPFMAYLPGYLNSINNYYYGPMGMNPYEQYQPKIMGQPPQPQNVISTKPRTINASNLITTTTANNKKIKRIDPQTYLDESYEYLAHNIFALAKDQAGCRFLQKKLEDEPEIATAQFYPALLPYILPLVKDPFGNYLIQKICHTINPDQIHQILSILSSNILDIGSNSHGTRVIQHIISYLKTPELINYFIQIIQPYVIPLLKELNGTHIIQKFNADYPDYAGIINQIVIDNCSSLATHRHGCCVLQKYLDSKDPVLRKKLIQALVDQCLDLIVDQFGNYVIQSVLLLNEVEACNAIAIKLVDNAAYYSKHKYSSNVVEKCFDHCDENARKKLIVVLSKPEVMNDLILDEHGNYVIQKVLACADSKTQSEMLANIGPIVGKLKSVSFGERIINRLITSYPQMASFINGKDKKSGKGGNKFSNQKKNKNQNAKKNYNK